MSVLYVLMAILLLAILIFVHELGHFLSARLTHIDVREFAMGFGPKLLGWQSKKHETTFAIRAIPLGGFCAFYGEDDPSGASKDDPRCFNNHKVWKRLLTIFMGPMMNFVLAYVIAVCLFLACGVGEVKGINPVVSQVMAAGPAYDAGLKDGDIISEINGVNMLDGTTTTLTDTIAAWQEGDAPLEMTVQRGEETLHMSLTPQWDEEEGRMLIGVMIGGQYLYDYVALSLPEALSYGAKYCWAAGTAVIDSLKQLVSASDALENTSGVVGIVSQVSEEIASGGLLIYLEMMIVISVNLGLMNLLPIPGLDGCRLLFGLIEAVRRKPIPRTVEAKIHLVGLFLLFALMILINARDIIRLFQ